MFFLCTPSDDRVLALLDERKDSSFTYRHVGATEADLDRAPAGFRLDRYGVVVGRGRAAYERCRRALARIDNYPPSFTRVVRREGVLEPGSLFGTVVEHFGFASVHPCRLIYVVDEEDRYGFGFGTLPGHAESGEERFVLRLDGDQVRYEVQAFSRPVGLLPRVGAPVTRSFQLRFQRETLDVMKAHATR